MSSNQDLLTLFNQSEYYALKYKNYFPIYEKLFSRFKGKKITFVEIGVLSGGSLFMWRDFFGPKARIIGIDLNPSAKKWEAEGFEIFIGSQSDENFWDNFIDKVGMVDVILDDGGHSYDQQIITTEKMLDNIRDNGILIVEDTHTSYMRGFGSQKYSFINYTKNFIDKINFRFGSFQEKKCDNRVWNIQIYESIVAFKINRKASNLSSKKTENEGIDDSANDFRYHDNKSITFMKKLRSSFKFLKFIPGSRYIFEFLLVRTSHFFLITSQL